jgi:DNA-binding beta-propeller fold protein YncE
MGSPNVTGNADSGAAGGPLFNGPSGIAVDTGSGPTAGNVYVADTWNNSIRLITRAGASFTVTTLAGTGQTGFDDGGAPGSAHPASFYGPQGVAVDGSGNVWVADTLAYTIRKITGIGTPSMAVATAAGTALEGGSTDSPALFTAPQALAVDPANGDVYVADTGNALLRRISGGVVSTVAGTVGIFGSADGPAGSATFLSPTGIAVDAHHTVYVADSGSETLRVLLAGTVTTFAGTTGQTGSTDAVGTSALFNHPCGVALNPGGTLLAVADSWNNTLRQVPLVPGAPVSGLTVASTSTYAGRAGQPGDVDNASLASARFAAPAGVAVDAAGTLWVADSTNATVRTVSILSGVTTPPFPPGSFYAPMGVAVDTFTGSGNIYVADPAAQCIQVISGGNNVSTLGGNGVYFDAPFGVAVDRAGNVYVADTYSNTVYMVTIPSPGVYPVTGTATVLPGTYNTPYAVAVDAGGTVYVADTWNNRIATVSGGVPGVLAGSGAAGFADGVGTAAQFNHPNGLALDAAGNLYVTDSNNQAVRRITTTGPAAGTVVTLVGVGTQGANAPGPLPGFLAFPMGIAVAPLLTTDASGNVNPGGSLVITVNDALLTAPY